MADETGLKTETVYSLVTSTRAKYFGEVEKSAKGIIINSAYEIKDAKETEPHALAKAYIKGFLYGDNRRIEISDSLVESVTECVDETRIVRNYMGMIPDARKRAEGVMTFRALEDLLTTK